MLQKKENQRVDRRVHERGEHIKIHEKLPQTNVAERHNGRESARANQDSQRDNENFDQDQNALIFNR